MSAISLEPIQKLTKDLRKAAVTLSDTEARYLVDSYYTMQANRIRSENQVRALSSTDEPHDVVAWLSEQAHSLEESVQKALKAYVESSEVGRWLLSIHGIAGTIGAGLLAHIDITKAPTVGHIWRYAGLDPTSKWEKGKKRPFNASLKVVCWKAGDQFMKHHNSEKCFYGHVYAQRKAQEIERNERGDFAEQAKSILEAKRFSKDTEAFKSYSEGKLPKAHIDARARRYAVKLFLAHLHHKMYEDHYKTAPPKPYVIEHLGHAHYIAPPE